VTVSTSKLTTTTSRLSSSLFAESELAALLVLGVDVARVHVDHTLESMTKDNLVAGSPTVPLERVTRAFALFLCLGVGLNIWTRYEWLLFRSTDLYSWAPASKSAYRYERGYGWFVLPLDLGKRINDVLVEDLPGVQVSQLDTTRHQALLDKNFDENDALHQELKRKLTRYQNEANVSSIENIPLTLKRLHVVYHVDDDNEPLDWVTWLSKTNIPRVKRRVFEDYHALTKVIGDFLAPLKERDYWQSKVYWLVMSLPLIFLVWDVRIPFYSTPSREALFTTLPQPVLMFIRWCVLPFFCWSCLWAAQSLSPSSPLWGKLSTLHCQLIMGFDMLASYAARSSSNTPLAAAVSRIACYASIMIRGFIALSVSLAMHNWEATNDQRYVSCTFSNFVQMLVAGLLSQLFIRLLAARGVSSGTAIKVNQDAIESGLYKFVLSMVMYTAGATKLGEAGLKWIDDRYIAQLSLRGRYGDDAPYPLESMMLWGPPSFRAIGMLVVLLMELFAVFSWWDFGRHYRAWQLFQIVSTLSIGVPIVPQRLAGPLGPQVAALIDIFKTNPKAWLAVWGIGLTVGSVLVVRNRRTGSIMAKQERKKLI